MYLINRLPDNLPRPIIIIPSADIHLCACAIEPRDLQTVLDCCWTTGPSLSLIFDITTS